MRALAAFGAAVAVMAAAGFLWLRTSLPQIDGTLRLAGLHGDVQILRDEHGVPHIFADDKSDAYFALGFVHAQDRLWQMELMRRAGAGRLAEVLGERALPNDRFIRTLGLYNLAEQSVARMPAEMHAVLDAYARGVNAFIAENPAAWPPEFVALRHQPGPWRPADSLVWGRLMALQLGFDWRTEALRARLSTRLTPSQIHDLWPTGTAWRQSNAAPPGELDQLAAVLLGSVPSELGPISASNAWAIAGTRTASGKPLLANDPHLGFRAPEMWYLVSLQAPGLSVAGATTPGVPFVILGHNDRIAWGFTTTQGDTQDLFVERLDPADDSKYLTPLGPQSFATHTETIAVRGHAPVSLVVRVTRHGPVVAGLDKDLDLIATGRHVLALASPALRPEDRTPEALWRLNNARDRSAFEAALRLFEVPEQNVIFADVDGEIGMVSAGLVPVRRSGDGSYPAEGWTGANDWTGYLHFEEWPKTFNPPSGRIANANNKPVGDDYPHFLGTYWPPPYRAERILELIDRSTGATPASIGAMQMDVVSNMARDLLPLMLRVVPTDDRARHAVSLLATWDGTMDAARPEPLIFTAWLRALVRAIAADETGPLFERLWDLRPDFVRLVLTRKTTWCDDITTPKVETCADALATSLSAAMEEVAISEGDDIATWRWDHVHRARFPHIPFSFVPLLRDLVELSAPVGGGETTVARAAMPIVGPEPFAAVHGPGLRAIYDLSNLAASRFIVATGQSGNPLSPHYDDLLRLWQTGQSFALDGTREALHQSAEGDLTLTPATR